MTPLSSADIGAGASPWASGSHMWTGITAILTANPAVNAMIIHWAIPTMPN